MKRWLWMLSCVALASACNGDDGDGSGGGMCETVQACGGDVAGVWNIQAICIEDVEAIANMGLDDPECRNAIDGVETDIEGTMTFEGGTSVTDATMMSDYHALLTLQCLRALSGVQDIDLATVCPALGEQYRQQGAFADASCEQSGQACECTLLQIRSLTTTYAYTIEGDQVMFQGDPGPTDYCVQGDTLRIGNTMGGDTQGAMTLTR